MLYDVYPIFPLCKCGNIDPYAEKQYTLPLYEFLDENNTFIYPPDGEFKTLFPATYHEGIKAAITQEFYYRQVGQYIPQKFLRRFHRLLNERQTAWIKLIDSEEIVKPEQATRNYDMTEERAQHVESENQGNASSNSQTVTSDSGNTTATSTATAWVSDTPDGSVSDIETYMSSANKNQSDSTGTSETTGNATTDGSSQNAGSSSGDLTENIHRYGNIGVTTFEKIIEGYRNSASWCAFEQVIFPEVNKLFFALM